MAGLTTPYGIRAEEVEVPLTAPAPAVARLVFDNGVERLDLRAEPDPDRLLRASFTEPVPIVRHTDHHIHVLYPIGARVLRRSQATVMRINPATPWTVEVRGSAAHVHADLSDVDVRDMRFRGAAHLTLVLGAPSQVCAIGFRSVKDLVIERPPDVPVEVRIVNGARRVRLDDRWLGAVGGGLVEQTPVRQRGGGRYVVTVSGSADTLTVVRSA